MPDSDKKHSVINPLNTTQDQNIFLNFYLIFSTGGIKQWLKAREINHRYRNLVDNSLNKLVSLSEIDLADIQKLLSTLPDVIFQAVIDQHFNADKQAPILFLKELNTQGLPENEIFELAISRLLNMAAFLERPTIKFALTKNQHGFILLQDNLLKLEDISHFTKDKFKPHRLTYLCSEYGELALREKIITAQTAAEFPDLKTLLSKNGLFALKNNQLTIKEAKRLHSLSVIKKEKPTRLEKKLDEIGQKKRTQQQPNAFFPNHGQTPTLQSCESAHRIK